MWILSLICSPPLKKNIWPPTTPPSDGIRTEKFAGENMAHGQFTLKNMKFISFLFGICPTKVSDEWSLIDIKRSQHKPDLKANNAIFQLI